MLRLLVSQTLSVTNICYHTERGREVVLQHAVGINTIFKLTFDLRIVDLVVIAAHKHTQRGRYVRQFVRNRL